MIKTLLILFLLSQIVFSFDSTELIEYNINHKSSTASTDRYDLFYNHKTRNCTLSKNNKNTVLFDKRFKKKQPKSPYTCTAWIKEQYSDCHLIDKKRVAAQSISFGRFEQTNLIIAIEADYRKLDSFIEVECIR